MTNKTTLKSIGMTVLIFAIFFMSSFLSALNFQILALLDLALGFIMIYILSEGFFKNKEKEEENETRR